MLFLPTRQTLRQVHVAVLCGEMHPLAGRGQQTLAGKDGHANLGVLLPGGGVLLDEDQVAHHHLLRLALEVETVSRRRRDNAAYNWLTANYTERLSV